MANHLPAPLARYFAAQNERDVEAMLAAFTADALVHDERREHRGTAAIRDWMVDVTNRYAPQIDVIETSADGKTVVVDVSVSGNFPGSPLRLRYALELTDEQRITRLEIS